MVELFLTSFTSLFVIVDPIGTAAVFVALTQGRDKRSSQFIALKATIIAASLLLFFALFGKTLLSQIGVSFDAFRIAGGLLLFVTAFRMIMGFHDSPSIQSKDSVYNDDTNIAVFPLAIPLLAGPGCMVAAILNIDLATTPSETYIVLFTMVAVQGIALLCMLFAFYIVRTIGNTGSNILARMMGILLAALSIQFIAEGLFSMIGIYQ